MEKHAVAKKSSLSYVNVNRVKAGYKDKYKKGVDTALSKFMKSIGKTDKEELTTSDWKRFFRTELIPLDKESEKHMIDLFMDDRPQLNKLLVLHNTLASNNLAEVYFKKYEKESPTKWHDLDDFRQMALEGLMIAAERFDPSLGNKFITFATWWVLNKVRKPRQEKGAGIGHNSLSQPVAPGDEDNSSTLEDTLTMDMVDGSWRCASGDDNVVNPVAVMERKQAAEGYETYSSLKHLTKSSLEEMDDAKIESMVSYLTSILKDKSNSYQDRQIFLYVFRQVFNKYSTVLKSLNHSRKAGDGRHQSQLNSRNIQELRGYVDEAAKSKAELLTRLDMTEDEYEKACQALIRHGYDGI